MHIVISLASYQVAIVLSGASTLSFFSRQPSANLLKLGRVFHFRLHAFTSADFADSSQACLQIASDLADIMHGAILSQKLFIMELSAAS